MAVYPRFNTKTNDCGLLAANKPIPTYRLWQISFVVPMLCKALNPKTVSPTIFLVIIYFIRSCH